MNNQRFAVGVGAPVDLDSAMGLTCMSPPPSSGLVLWGHFGSRNGGGGGGWAVGICSTFPSETFPYISSSSFHCRLSLFSSYLAACLKNNLLYIWKKPSPQMIPQLPPFQASRLLQPLPLSPSLSPFNPSVFLLYHSFGFPNHSPSPHFPRNKTGWGRQIPTGLVLTSTARCMPWMLLG